MDRSRSGPRLGLTDLALGSVVVAFSVNFRMGQLAGVMGGGERLDPRALILLRMLLVVPVLLPIAARGARKSLRQMLTLSRRELWLFAALGFAAIPCNQFLFLWGMQHTNTVHAALVFATSPVLAALIGRVILGDRTTPKLWLGMAVAFAGVALVVSRSVAPELATAAPGSARDDAEATLFGDLLILAAAVGWGAYAAVSAYAMRRRDALEVTALALVFGLGWCVVLFGGVLAREVAAGAFSRILPVGWGAIGYISYVGALYGWVVWTRGIQTIGPSRTMLYQYLVPVVTMGLGMSFFGEAISPRALAGGALVIGGVWIGRMSRIEGIKGKER